MPKVRLELQPWIAAKLGAKSTGWLTLEQEVVEDTTINDFLTTMIESYPNFRELIYNPDTGIVTEQINFVLNDRLLTFQEISETRLTDGDIILIIPLYTGG